MMVDLQNLKNAISTGAFSDDAKGAMLEIVDRAIAKGTMDAEQKARLLSIMDLEIDESETVQNVHEEVAEMLESFVAGVDAKVQTASDNLDALEEEKVEEEAPATTTEAQVATESPILQTEAPPSLTTTPTEPAMPAETMQPVAPPETPAQ